MKNYSTVTIKTNLLFILLHVVCVNSSCTNNDKIKPYILSNLITGKSFAINSKNELYFSGKLDNDFILYKYKDGCISTYKRKNKDLLNPFCIQDSVNACYDNNGDENFITTNSTLNLELKTKGIKEIFTSSISKLIIYNEIKSKDIYIFNLHNRVRKKIFTFKDKLNGVAFSSTYALISFDDNLVLMNMKNYSTKRIALKLSGPKLNPSINGNEIYFVNNSIGEFYKIYTINLKQLTLVNNYYEKNNDIKMPKKYKEKLFFIQIVKNKYLLTFIDDKKREKQITTDGVVFNYSIINDKVLYTYSDINSPKSFCVYDLINKSTTIYSSKKLKNDFVATYLVKAPKKSFGYKLMNKTTSLTKGVILYIKGGGKEDDFSPRWDDLLANLINNDYIIYAPNFPSSTGHGKSYMHASYNQSLSDLLDWKKYIINKHPNLKFYLLSSSSGNLLMEDILKIDDTNVKGSASIFGLYKHSRNLNLRHSLFILGENDPYVNFTQRVRNIKQNSLFMINKKIVSYNNEGHWLRKSDNIKDATYRIVTFFN